MDPTAKCLSDQQIVMAMDYGQFYIQGLQADPDADTDTDTDTDSDPMLDLLDQALANHPFASNSTMVVVLSPHQNNFRMPVTVQVWDTRPPDDTAEWEQVCETRLLVGPDATVDLSSPPDHDGASCTVPEGDYLIEISGRGFVNYGWPGTTTPDDVWRIRLWPNDGTDPRPARQWHMPGYGVPEDTPLPDLKSAIDVEPEWIGVIDADGNTRMMRQSEYEAYTAEAERVEWGGDPIPELRDHAGGHDLARYDRTLAAAIVAMTEHDLRQLARWCATRAYEHAGIAERDWTISALAAMNAGQPLPSPFDDLEKAYEILNQEEFGPKQASIGVLHATVFSTRDAASPNPFDLGPIHRPSFALPAVINACDPDPFTAAVTTLHDAAITFGPDVDTLFAQLRSNFGIIERNSAD